MVAAEAREVVASREDCHEREKRDEPRSETGSGDRSRQLFSGHLAAFRTRACVRLVLRHLVEPFRQVVDLVTNRWRIFRARVIGERRVAVFALPRQVRHHVVDFGGGKKLALSTCVPGLATALSSRTRLLLARRCPGGSEEGGFGEFREFVPSRALSSRITASNSVTFFSSARRASRSRARSRSSSRQRGQEGWLFLPFFMHRESARRAERLYRRFRKPGLFPLVNRVVKPGKQAWL